MSECVSQINTCSRSSLIRLDCSQVPFVSVRISYFIVNAIVLQRVCVSILILKKHIADQFDYQLKTQLAFFAHSDGEINDQNHNAQCEQHQTDDISLVYR